MSSDAYERILAALDAEDRVDHRNGRQSTARCPAHDDGQASLSIGAGDGRALVHCHAGCDTLDVLEALRLDWCDTFDGDPPKRYTRDGLRRAGATIEPDMRIRVGTVRYRPGAAKGQRKSHADDGSKRTIYPDPAEVPGPELWIVEGEGDYLTACTLALPAVAMPGASFTLKPEQAAGLAAGRRRVMVVVDSDGPGRTASARWAATLAEHCPDVRVLDLHPDHDDGADLSDWAKDARDDQDRAAALTLLHALAEQTEPVKATVTAEPEPAVLRELDVARMLREPPPPLDWIAEPLVLRGTVTMLAGREGSGKSMIAGSVAVAMPRGRNVAGIDCRPGTAVYIDAENGETEAWRRLRGLGLADPSRLRYFEADGFNLTKHLPLLEAIVRDAQADLLVLDSFRSLWPGGEENDSAAAEAAIQPLMRLSRRFNIGVLLLHHAGKVGNEYRGSTAIGAAVGIGLTLSRHEKDPERRERREISMWKNRHAPEQPSMWVRIGHDGEHITVTETDPFEAETVSATPGASRSDRREALRRNLVALVTEHGPQGQGALLRLAGLEADDSTGRRALGDALDAGELCRTGQGPYALNPPVRSGDSPDLTGTVSQVPPTGGPPDLTVPSRFNAEAKAA